MEFGPEIKETRIKLELSNESKELLERLQRKQTTRTECVRQMFVEVLPHQERNDKPTVPSEAAIRLQTRIDCEEFVEKIEALYDDRALVDVLRTVLGRIVQASPIRKNLHDRLPEFADALADNAVTNEGFAVLFGIDLEPVFQEVHSANMRKVDGPIIAGKRKKPDGWVGPDVAGVLRNQGWQPSFETKADEPIPYKLGTFDSLFVGGKPIRGVGEFSFERAEDLPDGMCALHGPLNGGDCVRCENAQYNGSEIDPIGEQSGNETTALAYLASEAAKVETGSQKEPTRYAIPIDSTLWTSDETVELPNVSVKIENFPVVSCKAKFLGSKRNRRLMIELPAAHKQFGRYEMLRRDEAICKLSIQGSYLGTVRVESVVLGSLRDDRNMQIAFVKVDVSGDV